MRLVPEGHAPPVNTTARFMIAALAALCACSNPARKTSQSGGTGDGPEAVAPPHLRTDDGLTLHFDQNTRQFTTWSVAGTTPDSTWSTPLSDPADTLGVWLSDHRGAPLLEPTPETVRDVIREPVAIETDDRERAGAGRDADTRLRLRVVREPAEGGLRVEEVWTAHARHLELQATISLTERPPNGASTGEVDGPRSQALEACVALPMDATGKVWHHHLHQSEVIADASEYRTLLTPGIDIGHYSPDGISSHLKSALPFNLHGLNAITDAGPAGAGVALAMHPQSPSSYFVSYDGARKQLRACFHLSIYGGHRTRPDRTELRLVFMSIDRPTWGLRSALDKYADIFAGHFRGQGPRQTGMTVGGGYKHAHYPRPADFHISAMWNALRERNRARGVKNLLYAWPTGYLERGLRLAARPTRGPCAECDRSIDAHVAACMQLYRDYEAGAVRFPETCDDTWSQRGCHASALPPTTDASYGPVRIRNYFYNLVPYQVIAPTSQALRLLGTFAVHDPLRRSILRGPDGRYQGALSDSMGLLPAPGTKGVYTCYMNGFNPDPGVLVRERANIVQSNPPRNTRPVVATDNFGHLNLEIAKRATGVYGVEYARQSPNSSLVFDGVAVDTTGAYLRPDFNLDMVAVASHPSAYDPDSGRPVALEHLGLSAFMSDLRAQLPERASIAINGYPISGTLGQGVDHFVRELARRWRMKPGDTQPRHYYELYDEELDLRLRRVYRLRMVAGQRPITFWARFHHTEARAKERGVTPERALLDDMRALIPLYTATGVYVYLQRTGVRQRPRFFGSPQPPELTAEYRQHLDTVNALTRAGWQSVPHVRATASGSDATLRIVSERFGGARYGAATLITAYNPGAEDARITLIIDWAAIGQGQELGQIRDLHTGQVVAPTGSGAQVRVELTLPKNGLRVLKLTPS